jgi:protein involved in polysaccharide export with SLBB domain
MNPNLFFRANAHGKSTGMLGSVHAWSRPILLLETAFLLLGLPYTGIGQGSSQSKAPEVRKAIPISPRSGNAGKGRESAGNAAGTVTGESTPRIVERTVTQAQAKEGDVESPSTAAAPNTMRALNDKRRIGIRDRLSFVVTEDELPPKPLIVTDSGEVDVPYIGRVEVQNRTCKELAMHVKRMLEKEFFYQATVLIGLDAAGGQTLSRGRYYVHGQVNRAGPQEIPVDEVLTISKAIIRAGGFTQYANDKKVRIVRKNAPRPIEIDMGPMMKKGDTRNDIEILPEDTIFVDEKFFNFF